MNFAGPGFAIQSSPEGALNIAVNAGENIISTVSKTYLKYNLAIGGSYRVSNDDINAIYDWIAATDISIADNQDTPHKLSQNPEKLQKLVELQHLGITVNENSYATLRLANFIKYLPKIRVIEVGVTPLNVRQVEELFENQGFLKGWAERIINNGNTVVFEKMN